MVYIFLADGFEELEAISVRDILKRAGVDVKTVGVGGEVIKSACGLKVQADILIENAGFKNLEAVVLPGGMPGTKNLEKSKKVADFINYCDQNKLLIAAICAAPSILGQKGLLKNMEAVCYPGFEKYLVGAKLCEKRVVTEKNIITSKGPGTALEFGYEILAYLKGKMTAEDLKKEMIYT